MLDLLHTVSGYVLIGITLLYFLRYVDWIKGLKRASPFLVFTFIAFLLLAKLFFFALITIGLIIIFSEKIAKSAFWEEN
tara:strand:+ start:255 stop:491 length:237 start_codon:yes stop_codon:yes gene_type:complete